MYFSGCIASIGSFVSQLIVPNPATGGKIAWRSVAAYGAFGYYYTLNYLNVYIYINVKSVIIFLSFGNNI